MSALATIPTAALYLHASAVVIGESGLVLRGPSGVGKSALALSLVEVAQRRGLFARLVGDDRVSVREAAGRLIVAPHPRIAGRIERRFIGIARVPHEPHAVAKLIVDLERDAHGASVTRLPSGSAGFTVVAGVRLRRIALPAAHPHLADMLLDIVRDSWNARPSLA